MRRPMKIQTARLWTVMGLLAATLFSADLSAAEQPDITKLSIAEINKVHPVTEVSPVPLYPAGRSPTPDVYPENCDAACIQRIAEKTQQERKTPRANERTSGTGVGWARFSDQQKHKIS